MKKLSSFSSCRSFTLVEMLTAMAVLGLLLAMIFGVVQSAAKLADSSERGGDSDIEARQVLDRIGVDIAGMLIRPDVDQLYSVNSGNDAMFFYTQQAGYFTWSSGGVPTAQQISQSNPVTLVGYRINANTTAHPLVPVLERLALGLTWDGNATTSMQFLTTSRAKTNATDYPPINGGTIPGQWGSVVGTGTYDNGVSSYYDTVGTQIFRLKVCFQLQDGSFSLYPGYTNSVPSATPPSGIANTAAIVVAIATLDSKSRQLIPAADWDTLIKAFPDPTTGDLGQSPPVLMDSTWNAKLQDQTVLDGLQGVGIPKAATSRIKVYQRYYYLNPPKAH